MAAFIDEKWDSRAGQGAAEGVTLDHLKDAVTVNYVIGGTTDDAEVRALLAATTPAFYPGTLMTVRNWNYKPLGGEWWEATVIYGGGGYQFLPAPADSTISKGYVKNWDTGGEKKKVNQSLATINAWPQGIANTNDFQGAIGVTGDGTVEGVDVPRPNYAWSETHYCYPALIDFAWENKAMRLTGSMNDAEFREWKKGEVLFLGVTGSQRTIEEIELTFKFLVTPNWEEEDDKYVGDQSLLIGPIIKYGWDYLWTRYVPRTVNGRLTKQPEAAYSEQVVNFGNFADLGIGTVR